MSGIWLLLQSLFKYSEQRAGFRSPDKIYGGLGLLTIRRLTALLFVPLNDVTDSFDTIRDYSRNGYGQDLNDMLDYLEDNYIGRFRHNTPRRRPTFNIGTCNMFHRTDNKLPEPVMRLKDGIAVSTRMLGLHYHHFGNSLIL